jgi:hypothetical protein
MYTAAAKGMAKANEVQRSAPARMNAAQQIGRSMASGSSVKLLYNMQSTIARTLQALYTCYYCY